jgi:hypothetical protein
MGETSDRVVEPDQRCATSANYCSRDALGGDPGESFAEPFPQVVVTSAAFVMTFNRQLERRAS